MEKLNQYLTLLKDHKQIVKIAVIILVMIAAVVVFGDYGEKDEIPVQLEGGSTEQPESPGAEGEESAGETAGGKIYVDISGEVKKPGVYEIGSGSRLFEVIEKAGGLTGDADTENINQAEIVTDGQKVVIPLKGEGGAAVAQSGGASDKTFSADGSININTADRAGLQEIPGVGPATADKIIAYRNANGRFSSIEDLLNVNGIGEKTFEKIKDKITV